MARAFRTSAAAIGSTTAGCTSRRCRAALAASTIDAVHLVGDVEHVAVGDAALRRIVVEQRPLRVAAQDERQLPRQVVAVVQAGVEPFAAERARQVGGVADQEPPAVRQARHDAPMHPERREPGRRRSVDTFAAEPRRDAGDDVSAGATCSTSSSRSWKLIQRPPGSGASSSRPSGPQTTPASSRGNGAGIAMSATRKWPR